MKISQISAALILATFAAAPALFAQTSSGTINATLVNKSGIALVFNSHPSGVALTGAGTAAATADFGTVSALGPWAAGVTRTALTGTSFTVQTSFYTYVSSGGASPSYNLTGALSAAAATGFSYLINGVTLTTTAQTVASTQTYNADVTQTLSLTILTAAPGAGGPATGAPVTGTINITATAN